MSRRCFSTCFTFLAGLQLLSSGGCRVSAGFELLSPGGCRVFNFCHFCPSSWRSLLLFLEFPLLSLFFLFFSEFRLLQHSAQRPLYILAAVDNVVQHANNAELPKLHAQSHPVEQQNDYNFTPGGARAEINHGKPSGCGGDNDMAVLADRRNSTPRSSMGHSVEYTKNCCVANNRMIPGAWAYGRLIQPGVV